MAYDFYKSFMGDEPQNIIRSGYDGDSYFPEIRNTEDYYRTSLAAQNSMAQRTARDNEMSKAAEWAQHLHPETVAGLNVGNILGKVLLPSVAQATQNWGNKLYGTLFGKKNDNSQQTVNSDAINKGINSLLASLQKNPSLGLNFNVSNPQTPSTNLNLPEQYNNTDTLVNNASKNFAKVPTQQTPSLNLPPISNYIYDVLSPNYSPTYPSTYNLPKPNLGIDYNSYFKG